MRYATGQTAAIGDAVDLDGMAGIVVCDFDRRRFAAGYESWDAPSVEMVGGGTLSSGVMILTVEAGLIHCGDEDDIELVGDAAP